MEFKNTIEGNFFFIPEGSTAGYTKMEPVLWEIMLMSGFECTELFPLCRGEQEILFWFI